MTDESGEPLGQLGIWFISLGVGSMMSSEEKQTMREGQKVLTTVEAVIRRPLPDSSEKPGCSMPQSCQTVHSQNLEYYSKT